MQRVWYWIKRGAIFLVLWLVVSGLVAVVLFALICCFANADFPAWLRERDANAQDLFEDLLELAMESFLLTYLFKGTVCRRFHLMRRQKYLANTGLFAFFYMALGALYATLHYVRF